MHRLVALGVVLVCLSSAAALPDGSAAPQEAGTQMALSIKFYEQASPVSRRKMLAEPTIAAVSGRPFRFHSGGETKSGVAFGIRVNGQFDRTDAGAWQLALNLAVGEKVVTNKEADVELVTSEAIELRMVLEPGKTRRLHCAGPRWCEVRIDPLR